MFNLFRSKEVAVKKEEPKVPESQSGPFQKIAKREIEKSKFSILIL